MRRVPEALPCGLDDGNGGIGVAPLPQDPVLEEVVLDDRDGDAQLHGDARLPLADPQRMFLEDRKDLLLLRDLLPLQDPPVRLVDLALRMRRPSSSSSSGRAPRSSRLARVASAFASSASHLARNASTSSRQASEHRVLATR